MVKEIIFVVVFVMRMVDVDFGFEGNIFFFVCLIVVICCYISGGDISF